MTPEEMLHDDYKSYEKNGVKYGIGCIRVAAEEDIDAMMELLKTTAKKSGTVTPNSFSFVCLMTTIRLIYRLRRKES